SKSAEQLRWSVDFDLRIDLQKMVQAACMISVTMRNHDKVQIVQINIHGTSIGGKDSGVIAGIKQNLLARILDQHRECPIFRDVSRVAESIVKNGSPARGASRGGTTNGQEQATEQAKPIHRQMHVVKPPRFMVRDKNRITMLAAQVAFCGRRDLPHFAALT